MKRRELLLGCAAVVWPLGARAQQTPLPVIGFLGAASPEEYAIRLRAFRQGLKEAGYVEGQNVAIEYRWADAHNERLPGLAAELVQHQVAVIVGAGGAPSTAAAKAATSTIPIVFATSVDPVRAGFVASLNRPGGNVTGVANQNGELGPKRLELLHELLPKGQTTIAVLVNPTGPNTAEQLRTLQSAAEALGMQLHPVEASTERDLNTAFANVVQLRADALVINPDVFLSGISEQLAAQALRRALPAVYEYRQFAAAGGLVSYGASETEYYRLVGVQVAKVLNGEKPADLPVQQSTKIELIINLKTAKALGLTIPQSILARADEVIE
ncbi:MAG TPA: ABC transporter substrate-binding protein [Stellaceae bacterium]|nr:ABC transporter substrate-binding protein [Stellaceae bacterium]